MTVTNWTIRVLGDARWYTPVIEKATPAGAGIADPAGSPIPVRTGP